MNYTDKYLKYKAKYNSLKKELNQHTVKSGGTDKLILLHANWCGHCTQFMATWNKIQQTNQKYPNVIFKSYEDAANRHIMNKYNVQGYPTIIFEKSDNTIIQFTGNRTETELQNFILKHAT